MDSKALERLSRSRRKPISVDVSRASSVVKVLRKKRWGSMYLLCSSAYWALNSSMPPPSLFSLSAALYFGGFLPPTYFLPSIRSSYSPRLTSLGKFSSSNRTPSAPAFFGVGDYEIICSLGSNLVLNIWVDLSICILISSGDFSLSA
jgi:hypothetical protein